ncbi:sulfite exporter TauE/SafE family protein [Planosporangium thailandense]|uniref:Probable membrane transporter protein n=2 Tax=Planosporangium thailandense TaxID=765197 RepID=A0ABX0XX18_9ACTN|nr:sulfite exporter TauE/SafE family protein [Planosporangium thailandense]NJC70581.1 sulfite exporter TauE/SafE family protein [Planosporangium thailandense]
MALFGLAALLVGFSKTAIGGLSSISIAIFASLMPARESTAAILLMLIVGDVMAVWNYRHDCDWSLLRRLIPSVLPGLALGALFLGAIDDNVLRRVIGALLIVMALLQLLLRWRSPTRGGLAYGRTAAIGAGLAAGFTTMVANAAGPVMTLYLVAQGVDKRRFLGTGALFFFGVNLCKLPFSAGLGLFHAATLTRALALAPLVLVGGWAGVRVARKISQVRFDQAVLGASVLAALALVLR